MRVSVDASKCDGFAVCELHAPQIFEVGDDNLAHVLIETPPTALSSPAREAARSCPAQAIQLQENA